MALINVKGKYALTHRDGSRKSRVHAMFDAKGDKAAFAFGRKLKLRETTLRSWFAQFRKCGTAVKRAKKAA